MARQMKTMDGNMAAAHVAYAFTDVAAIYPITPSTPMADITDAWSTQGKKNIFGHEVVLSEMESEAGAAGAVHGSLVAGALTTTYTASQGLLLMIPNMYKMAGELLPSVIHVAARTIASHALSIFGDHSDVYACRQTGYAMLCSSSVQEIMDLGAVAHLTAIKGRVPFLHFFDGFRTSHEIQKISIWDYDDLKDMCDMEAVEAFHKDALNPEHPQIRGTAQNPDIFFQVREACNSYYEAIPELTQQYMDKVNEKIGTNYSLFNYYGASDATHIIIAMGSVCDTIEETIDYMNENGAKVGLVKVHLYRPFSKNHLLAAIPDSVQQITVLDRTKEPGAIGEPLYLDVVAALQDSKFSNVCVYGGRYGLSSKDTTPAQIVAVFNNTEKKRFTVGIVDDVTNLSLQVNKMESMTPESTINCKFWGLGADGTVGANKNSIKIIGDHTDLYAQAYFAYDSKKSGGVTISHLRFGEKPIKSTYLIEKANFVACHCPAYIRQYKMVEELVDGGTFLLNCSWNEEELDKHLPGQVKRYMAEHNIKFYTIDGIKIGREVGLGGRINTILQAAFFKLSQCIPTEEAVGYMKKAATASYSKKGDEIVAMNHKAIDRGISDIVEVKIPKSWLDAQDDELIVKVKGRRQETVDYVNSIQSKINAQEGNDLPVSAFTDYVTGRIPLGSAAYEKRGIAVDVPRWIPENCIQCNFCSYVCPHAVIRPVILNKEQESQAPKSQTLLEATGLKDHKFAISVSVLDCTGCGSCINVCPGKRGQKALTYDKIAHVLNQQQFFDFAVEQETPEIVFDKFKETTIKGSQFKQPLLEFHGACAGCGETPYAKLVTQLFGERMYIANATGCSSIWGGSSPASPYTVNHEGKGPAWANSLFEDNAQFGFGMLLAQKALRKRLIGAIEELSDQATKDDMLYDACVEYLATQNQSGANAVATKKLVQVLESVDQSNSNIREILKNKEFLSKKSQWLFGGDGWAYDIGYGGLDHILASGENINILVFDTEVYSNTGGQSSKATPTGAIAQFAAAGKYIPKKDLAAIAMTYGYVYVAQVAQGADYNQCLKAFIEAENYEGPSIVIAYSPCINHGIKIGLGESMTEERLAVLAGYWHLFRYDPRLKAEGKSPFQLDSKEPTGDYKEFINGEIRYNRLARTNAERAEELFDKATEDAKEKYIRLAKLADRE